MPDTSTDVVGTRTPAGWSFVPAPTWHGHPMPATFVVEVAVGSGGFRLDGRPVPVSSMARLITAVGGTATDRLMVVPHGGIPAGPARDVLFGTLAAALGAPLTVADASSDRVDSRVADAPSDRVDSRVAADGAAAAPDVVATHAQDDVNDGAAVDTVAGGAGVEGVGVEPVRIDRACRELLDAVRWLRPWDAVRLPPAPRPAPEPVAPAAPEPVAPAVTAPSAPDGPLWIAGRDWSGDDRTRLRRALHDRYDLHARTVERTIAEEPGLRVGVNTGDLVTDLVALRVYALEERDRVDEALRTGALSDPLLARGAAAGLSRLPAVLGPVFATGPAVTPATGPAGPAVTPAAGPAVGQAGVPAAGQIAGTAVGGYRTGAELVEPAFLDVDLRRPAPGGGIEYVIWSVGAHRLGVLDPGRPTAAMFPPGSRFVVLDVEPDRVLLAELTAGDRTRTTQRLRAALARTDGSAPLRQLTFAPGLDAHGVPFTPAPHAHGGL